jgi:hypothetical protein
MSETTAEPLGEVTSDATPAPTIDDTLSAAYDRAQEGAEDATEPGEGETPAEGAEAAPEGQERGPDGKFVAKEGAAPAEAAPPTPQQPAIPDYIAPYAGEFQRRGIAPEVGVRNLLDTWQKLETNPEQTLNWLAQQYGFTVVRPGQQGQNAAPQQAQQAAPQQDEWVDPAILTLRQELEQIKARETQREQQAQAAQAATYQHAYSSVANEVQTFAQNKAKADGIDFDALRPTMAALISSGQAETLEDAYDKAVWANPTTRAAKIEADRKQSEAKAAAENATKAAAARRAGQVNVRTDTAIPAKGRTIDETLARAYEEAQARA